LVVCKGMLYDAMKRQAQKNPYEMGF
jgi:hypothetical protein